LPISFSAPYGKRTLIKLKFSLDNIT
jgi:hypothetical protein